MTTPTTSEKSQSSANGKLESIPFSNTQTPLRIPEQYKNAAVIKPSRHPTMGQGDNGHAPKNRALSRLKQRRPKIFRFFSHSATRHAAKAAKAVNPLELGTTANPRFFPPARLPPNDKHAASLAGVVTTTCKPSRMKAEIFARDLSRDVSDVFLDIRKLATQDSLTPTTSTTSTGAAGHLQTRRKSKLVKPKTLLRKKNKHVEEKIVDHENGSESLVGSVLSIPSPTSSSVSSSTGTSGRSKNAMRKIQPQVLLPEEVFTEALPWNRNPRDDQFGSSNLTDNDTLKTGFDTSSSKNRSRTPLPSENKVATLLDPEEFKQNLPSPMNTTNFPVPILATFQPILSEIPPEMAHDPAFSNPGYGKPVGLFTNTPNVDEEVESSDDSLVTLEEALDRKCLLGDHYPNTISRRAISRRDCYEEGLDETGQCEFFCSQEGIIFDNPPMLAEDENQTEEQLELQGLKDVDTMVELEPNKWVPLYGWKETLEYPRTTGKNTTCSLMIQCLSCGNGIHAICNATHVVCPLCHCILPRPKNGKEEVNCSQPDGKASDPIVALGFLMHEWEQMQSMEAWSKHCAVSDRV